MQIFHGRKIRSPRGFTIVEMLISLSIFAVITVMAVANFRAGAQGDELRVSARLVASTVRRAQTQAIAGSSVFFCRGGSDEGKVCATGDDLDCGGGGTCVRDIPKAWGVRISALEGENRAVTVFADTNGNGAYDEGEAVRSEAISPGPFVSVVSVEPDDVGVLDIVFTPPKPKTTFNGSTAIGVATIELRHRHTDAAQFVTVNRISGLVTVE